MAYNNHKEIAGNYLLTAGIFSLAGTLFSLLIRSELGCTGSRIICIESLQAYNVVLTLHGVTMIFLFLMPALFAGFGNYFLPIMIGSSEVLLPRFNALSYFILPIGGLVILHSVLSDYGCGVGWTMYPPLSSSLQSLNTESVDWLIGGLCILGLGSIFGSINFLGSSTFLGGVNNARCTVLFVWAICLTALMLIITLPILTGGLLMILLDLHCATGYFDALSEGDSVLYQHLFWFFGHPEVYILILPAFGVISHAISVLASRQVFGAQGMILAMSSISILGSLVWVHHMMTVGLEVDTRAYFSAVTIMIAIPTGTKIFNWVMTYVGSHLEIPHSELVCVLCFILLFTLGGTTGVVMGNGAMDIALHDTYYIVAHFHFVLSLGAVLGTMCGVFTFYVDMLGGSKNTLFTVHPLDSISLCWVTIFVSAILIAFVPMHILSFNVMPRRIPDMHDYLHYIQSVVSLGSLSAGLLVAYTLI